MESGFGVVEVKCAHRHKSGEKVHLLARPLTVDAEQEPNSVQGTVTDAIFQQDRFKVTLDNGLYVYVSHMPQVGEKIEVHVRVKCLA